MGKVKGKHRLDKYYHLAKEHGYRSRASFKIIQIDAKYDLFRSSRAVLDLCAAPGSWMQVAVEKVPVGSVVVGIDLAPIRPMRGAVSFQQDITKPECRTKIKKVMNERGCQAFDLVLHDGAPNVGGAWYQESMVQSSLTIEALKLATEFLAPKGTFVTKVFRSQDYDSIRYCLRQLFEKVEVDKPSASRGVSAEIYLLGLKYKAPAKIDPRLLDVRHLFQGSVEPQKKVVDVLKGTKQKRHRDGYEDGDTTLRKTCSAADFIHSDKNHALEILGSVTSISFKDADALHIRDHELTTEEVKILCDDLRVLGKQDFRHLLKWHRNMKKALASPENNNATHATMVENENENKDEDDSDSDKDEEILDEMAERAYEVERKKKRAKKLDAKRKEKDKARKAMGMQIDVMKDGYIDNELFSLSSIKGKKDLAAVDSTEYVGEEGDVADSENDEIQEDDQDHSSSDMEDSDEERKRYDEKMEEILDRDYEHYVSRKEGSAKQRKRVKKSYEDDKLLEADGSDDIAKSNLESDEDQVEEDGNPLMVPLDEGNEPTQDEITNKWFSQDIFAEAVEEGDFENSDSEDEMEIDNQAEETSLNKNTKKEEEDKANLPIALGHPATQNSKRQDDFEIVPAPATDSSDSSSSDESDEDDVDTKAEILACAKKMLRKKQREQMLDDAYNKYMFDDEGLPKWFLDEERRHQQPIKPVTKEEIAAMRAQFKEIDARPAKKVAEAKARKKRAAMKKLEKVRKKANVISDQTDISDRSKRKQIEQLYKKAIPKRPQKEYVVAKKGVQVKAGKGKVLVDRRMKKDARTKGMSKPGKGGSKKGKNAKAQKGKGSMKASARKGKRGNNA